MKEMFSHDWNRIVQAMDATENKTDGKSQAIAMWDLDTCDDWNGRGLGVGLIFLLARAG